MNDEQSLRRQHFNETFQIMKDMLDALSDAASKRRMVSMLAASIDFEILPPRFLKKKMFAYSAKKRS